MKITRTQLRRLIYESVKIIVDPKGVATPADDAWKSGRRKSLAAAALHPKIGSLMGDLDDLEAGDTLPREWNMTQAGWEYDKNAISSRNQARELAASFDPELEMSPAESLATDIYGKIDSKKDWSSDDVIIDVAETLIKAIKLKSKNAIKHIFKEVLYAEDMPIEKLRTYTGDNDEYYTKNMHLKNISNMLGCKIEDLAFISKSNAGESKFFEIKRYINTEGDYVGGTAARYNDGTVVSMQDVNGVKIVAHVVGRPGRASNQWTNPENLWFCGK